jgi:hypothetical protein
MFLMLNCSENNCAHQKDIIPKLFVNTRTRIALIICLIMRYKQMICATRCFDSWFQTVPNNLKRTLLIIISYLFVQRIRVHGSKHSFVLFIHPFPTFLFQRDIWSCIVPKGNFLQGAFHLLI